MKGYAASLPHCGILFQPYVTVIILLRPGLANGVVTNGLHVLSSSTSIQMSILNFNDDFIQVNKGVAILLLDANSLSMPYRISPKIIHVWT